MMWDNGGNMIFSPQPDYEDLILQRQEEQEIAEDMGYIFPDVIADCPYSDGGTCDGCTQGMHGGCYYG